ncbi:MAG: hypothetical protein JRI34_04470 [Deltaproteobacteria bacterium]|nr:hypothetical protein [Deltaproteobacteria bacterium]
MAGKTVYLQQTYSCAEFVIRGVYVCYAGWYNDKSSELFPVKRIEIAPEVVKVSGADKLLSRIKELHKEGDWQLALNLVDF